MVDVRNRYGVDIGRFDGQEKGAGEGATYIDPKMRKSTDFVPWLAKEETKAALEGKNVLMYCTGGVRCERASVLLKQQVGDSVAGVFQLQGGIEKYLKEFPDGGFWQGKILGTAIPLQFHSPKRKNPHFSDTVQIERQPSSEIPHGSVFTYVLQQPELR